MQRRIKVGVIRGGPGAGYEASLNTGAAILRTMRGRLEDAYEPVDVLIDKKGEWFIAGKRILPEDSGRFFDIAWIALHGAYGGSGRIQSIFEAHGIPFTGSGALSSAVGTNKILTKQILKDAGIKSPYWKELASAQVAEDPNAAVEELFTTFTFPAVVKPSQGGSSVGLSVVTAKQDILPALLEAARHGDTILVEEFIQGDEASCGVIDGFRGQELYALPPVEIKAGKAPEGIVPARFPLAMNRELERLAKAVHQILQLRHYSRTDFIIHPRRGIYVLETNTLPGMTDESLIPKALRAVGSDLHELIDHVIRRELGV